MVRLSTLAVGTSTVIARRDNSGIQTVPPARMALKTRRHADRTMSTAEWSSLARAQDVLSTMKEPIMGREQISRARPVRVRTSSSQAVLTIMPTARFAATAPAHEDRDGYRNRLAPKLHYLDLIDRALLRWCSRALTSRAAPGRPGYHDHAISAKPSRTRSQQGRIAASRAESGVESQRMSTRRRWKGDPLTLQADTVEATLSWPRRALGPEPATTGRGYATPTIVDRHCQSGPSDAHARIIP